MRLVLHEYLKNSAVHLTQAALKHRPHAARARAARTAGTCAGLGRRPMHVPASLDGPKPSSWGFAFWTYSKSGHVNCGRAPPVHVPRKWPGVHRAELGFCFFWPEIRGHVSRGRGGKSPRPGRRRDLGARGLPRSRARRRVRCTRAQIRSRRNPFPPGIPGGRRTPFGLAPPRGLAL